MRTLAPVALVVALLFAADARAQEGDDIPNAVLLGQPEAPRKLKLMDRDHLAPGHSDVGLEVGEYFAAAGVQLGASFVMVMVLGPIIFSASSDQPRRDFDQTIGIITAFTPVLLALPSSFVAYKMSQRCASRSHSWGYTFLAGVLSSAAVNWTAAMLATGAFSRFSRNESLGAFVTVLAGALIPPVAEVLTLHLTSTEVVAAPVVLKDGAGVALALSF